MAIVARNNITVSNVNDGSITHTAYAYSADGTDRFTTVYPNLNLLTGTSGPFIMGYGIPNTTWDTTNQVSRISLPLTVIDTKTEVLPQGTGFPYMYISGVTYTQSIYISTDAPLTGTSIKFTWFTSKYGHNTSGVDNLVKVSNNIYRATSTYTWPPSNSSDTYGRNADLMNLTKVFDFTKGTFLQFYKPKLEPGSVATPWMPSSSEVKTADWPSYIGQYSDFTSTVSTDPAKYAPWTIFKGNDGTGIQTTVITYAISTSGTTAPSTGWTSSVPTLVKGQYLWTKTAWTYTDNSSKTGYSVTYISKDGIDGQPGANAPTITNVQDQIYLSTSNTVQSGGSWEILIPAWSSGKYYWSRVATTFSNGMTTYSIPVLDEALNQAATNQIKVTQLTQDLDGFKTTVSNTYLSKSDASGTYADKVSVTSQINQSATQVTQNIQSWTNGQLSSYSTIQSTDSSIASAVADKADKSQITQLSDNINLKVSKGDVISSINQEAGQIVFNANKLVLNANTTEITGDAFIGGDMIVDGSINAEKIVTNNLSAISSSLGDITGGSYTSWLVDMDPGGNPILNGIYLYNGRLRSVSITNPISTDPKEVGGIVNSSISGMEMFGGYTDYYYGEYNLANGTAEDMIKGINGMSFWSQRNDTGAYIGRIVGFQLPDKDPYLLISAPRLLVNGNVEVGGNIEASGDMVGAREHHRAVPIGWGLQMNVTRIGSLVIANVYRQIINMTTTGENLLMNERIPVGYRPHQNHAFSVGRNSGASIAAMATYLLGSDGTIRITSTSGAFVYQGSTTWYTRDAIVD